MPQTGIAAIYIGNIPELPTPAISDRSRQQPAETVRAMGHLTGGCQGSQATGTRRCSVFVSCWPCGSF